MLDKLSEKLKPDYVIPFKLDKKAAKAPQIDRIAEDLGTHVSSSGTTHGGGTKFQAKKNHRD